MELSPAKRFEELLVWQKAHQVVLSVYKFSKDFPQSELYGLTSQLRRAAVSVAANIAEGFKKHSRLDKIRFMNIAQGSLEETKYYLILAKDLGYGNSEAIQKSAEEVGRLLGAYIKGIHKNAKLPKQS
jgi:four helix bundle protein